MAEFTSSSWKNGYQVYSMYEGRLEIGYIYLFENLKRIYETNVSVYVEYPTSFILHCEYPEEKLNDIKKFFYDTYPAVETVLPGIGSILVRMKIKTYITKI
jgi:hypothetical protein